MMTDPIADMLTRIRNANRIEPPAVDMPATQLKQHVAQVLKDEGFILDYQVGKFVANEQGRQVFQTDGGRPGRAEQGPARLPEVRPRGRARHPPHRAGQQARPAALYRGYKELRPVLDGLGIAILSTSQGVMSDRQARAQRLGGELLCTVW